MFHEVTAFLEDSGAVDRRQPGDDYSEGLAACVGVESGYFLVVGGW